MRAHKKLSLFVLVGVLAVALLVAAATAGVSTANSTAVSKKAVLKGSSAHPAVTGVATWKSQSGERELEVEIQHAKPLKGKTLWVRIGGKLVGKMTVSSLGRARLTRDTAAGQSVPTAVGGKSVKVRTAGGALVASGSF
jgi:serine protease inhibitor ecotin